MSDLEIADLDYVKELAGDPLSKANRKISLLQRENAKLKDEVAYLMTLQPCGDIQAIELGLKFSNEHKINLTNMEARIISLLLRREIVFTEQLQAIWIACNPDGVSDNTHRQYIWRLRQKLKGIARIENRRGIGYSLILESNDDGEQK